MWNKSVQSDPIVLLVTVIFDRFHLNEIQLVTFDLYSRDYFKVCVYLYRKSIETTTTSKTSQTV